MSCSQLSCFFMISSTIIVYIFVNELITDFIDCRYYSSLDQIFKIAIISIQFILLEVKQHLKKAAIHDIDSICMKYSRSI